VRERIQEVVDWGRRIALDYGHYRASLAAGGLAYFVALSMAPAALAFGTLAGVFLDPAEVRAVLERFAAQTPDVAGALQPAIDALVETIESASATSFTITTLVSVLIAIYAASKVVMGVRMAMNAVFGVDAKRRGLILRAFSTVITLIGMVAAVAVAVVLTVLPQILDWLGVNDVSAALDQWWLTWPMAVLLLYFGSRWVLRHAPSTPVAVPWLSWGALVTTGGVLGATVGVGIYARFSASLGAAILIFGTAVVILLWLYLCFVALLWGAIVEADRIRTRTTSEALQQAP
jgi:membrane protein